MVVRMLQCAGCEGGTSNIGAIFLYFKDFTAPEVPRVAESEPVSGNPFLVVKVKDEFIGISFFVPNL